MNLHTFVLDIEAYTQQRLSRYISELSELCAIDSYTYHKSGLDEMARLLAARMRSIGMDTTIIENEKWGNDLLGTIRGEGHGNVLLLGHMDTVYPVGTAAERPLRLENNMLYGPGVSDMKGCLLAAIYAIEALLDQGYRDFGELRFLCVSDEEITNRHCKETIRFVSQGCQGALVLEAARANGDIVSARKGNASYMLTAHGCSAHAGVEPEKGRNAIIEIAHQTLQFQSLDGWREGISVNPGVISGGTMPNVVPELAQVRFDLRFLHSQDRVATEERWRKLMQQHRIAEVELTLAMEPDYKEPMVATAASMALVQHTQELASWLGIALNHVLSGGASDGSYTASYGVPTIDGLGPIGGRDHSPDEYLQADSVASRTALLAGLIAIIGAHH